MRKRVVLFLIGVIALALPGWGITIEGTSYKLDTLVQPHDIGPGTKYAFYDVPDYPLKIHVMEVDLTNPYVDIETCLSGDKAVATETPSSMAARNDRPGHEVIGATNGDFYQYIDPIEIGIPRSGQYRRNECVTNPVGRASFVLTPDRVPYIDRVNFSGTVSAGENSHRLHAVNMQRLEWEPETASNFMLLYTNAYGEETHATTGGTKVMLHAKEGDLFFSANKNIVCVVDSVFDNPGVSPIPQQRAVLYGVGTAETFLKTLSAGDEVTIFLKTDLASAPGLLTDFKEQMGGSDHIILRNGTVADLWDEAHPRTCMGISQDKTKVYLMVVDGRRTGYSAGATLRVLGDIFLAMGAYDAVNLDGGGSSAMVINHEIVNRPSDNKERAVGNGVLVISNAPVDNNPARLEFEPINYTLPTYCRFIPQVTAYNQYGLIVDPDFTEYTLSCSPEIGYIDENNAFVASGKPGSGTITATYNGISVTKNVSIQETGFAMRLDSVILDGYRDYPIEISAILNEQEFTLNPSTPQWEVSDPEICALSDGVLSGLKNGTTTVTGTLDNFTGSLKVKVEIPEYHAQQADPFTDDWTITSISAINDATLTPAATGGSNLEYTYKSGRQPYIQIAKTLDLYSIPDTFKITINTGETKCSKITMSLKSKLMATSQVIEWPEVASNEDYSYALAMNDFVDDSEDLGNYPVQFQYLKFFLDASSQTSGEKYNIHIKAFDLIYDHITLSVENVAIASQLLVYPNPLKAGESELYLRMEEAGELQASVYDLNGKLLVSKDYGRCESGIIALPAADLQPGNYLLQLTVNGKNETVKVIIK